MKKPIITNNFRAGVAVVAVLLASFLGTAFAQNPYPDYNFKAANADGDTLYYRITSAIAPYTVAVTRCHDSAAYDLQLPLNDYDNTIVIPATVTYNDITYDITVVDEKAFSLQQGIRTVQLPSGVGLVGSGAFAHSSLRNITIPGSVAVIEDSAFAYTHVESVVIPGGVAVLKTGTFVGCDSLRHLTLNEGLQEMEANIFSYSLIDTLILPASLRRFNPLSDTVLPCKRIVFQTDSLHPDDTLHLSPSCFRGMDQHLQTVVFSDNIFQLPNGCFSGFRKLTGTVTLPNRLSVIPYRCFYDCKFYDIQFPESLDTIADQAFMSSFVDHPVFTIPANTKHIGSRAFYSGDIRIFILECEQPPTLGENAFNTNRQNEFTVPCGTLPLYLTAPGWSSVVTGQMVSIGEDDGCVGVEDYDPIALKVYPNPVENVVTVELNGGAGIANIALYDLQGRIVVMNDDSPLQATVTSNVQNLPAGVYLLSVTDSEGNEYHRKVVKN